MTTKQHPVWLTEDQIRAVYGCTSKHLHRSPDLETASKAMVRALDAANSRHTPRVFDHDRAQDLMRVTAQHFGLSVEDLVSHGRTRSLVLPRQVAMYLVREITGLSYPWIGELFDRDHTTVMGAHRKIERDIYRKPSVLKHVQTIREKAELRKEAS